jgi:Cu(I)/Ag(I) efflux system protein CusF
MKRIHPTLTAFLAMTATSLALAQATLPPTEGEVRKVDKETGKVTLKHGEIKNLEMPGMTMVFQVKDPALLEKVKAGDQVSFTADKVNGAYTVLTIEPRK